MRKHLIGTILVLAALVACNKEIDTQTPAIVDPVEETPAGKVTLTFKATIGEETRTTYANDKTASWAAGDKISVRVTDGTNFETAEFSTTDGETFTGQVTNRYTTIVSGVYPANDNHVFSGGSVQSVYLKDSYDLGTANDGGIALPMVGEMKKGAFTFHHICGALKIEIVDIFNALTFTTAETITGSFELNADGRIEIPANGDGSTVTFTYGRLQNYLDDGNFGPRYSRTFYIPVPDGTLSGGATMALKNDDNKVVYEKKTSVTNEISFNSNKIRRFPEIGLNQREGWSITPDLSGANPEIVFDPDDENQLYIRLSTTKSTFETTYHGSVEAFLEARIQSNSNSTQTGLQPYTPKTNSIPTTTEDYLQDPEKVYIMCGVNKTGYTDRKCDLDYYIYQVTLEDPATDSYRAWLGQWTVNDGTNEDTWTISRKKANSTYTITGVVGRSSIKVEGKFSTSNSTLSISSQADVGTYSSNTVSLLKIRASDSATITTIPVTITRMQLSDGIVSFDSEYHHGYGFYWKNDSNKWTTYASLKRSPISSMTRVTE